MSHQYVTAKKGTADFDKLITGTFSQELRALPVQSLRAGSADEEVTFELVDSKTIKTPSRVEMIRQFLQTKKLLFVLFPVFYFVVRDWNLPQISSEELMCIIAGLVLSLLAIQIKVDIEDFISGYDRIRGLRGQKVLNLGQRTVVQLEKDFKKAVVLAAALSALPIFLEQKRILAVLAGVALFYLGYKWGVSQRNRLNRDLALAMIAGPCLAYGILPEFSSLIFGITWGFFIFFALQLEHFQHYFAQTQAGEKNLMTLKSFDQAPRMLWYSWSFSLFAYICMRLITSQIALWGGSVLILMVLSFLWRKNLFNLKSPAGSEIDKMALAGHQLYYTFISLWIAELLFQALIAPLVFAWFK